MKRCPFCAEQIQKDAIKCRYCGEILIATQMKTDNVPPKAIQSFFTSLSIMYWPAALLGTGGLGYLSAHYFNLGDPASGYKAVVAAVIFAVVSPIVWRAADSLRRYAAPSMYFGSGFFDMIGKRFFWTYGPQLIALGCIALAMVLYIDNAAKMASATPAAATQEHSASKQPDEIKGSETKENNS